MGTTVLDLRLDSAGVIEHLRSIIFATNEDFDCQLKIECSFT